MKPTDAEEFKRFMNHVIDDVKADPAAEGSLQEPLTAGKRTVAMDNGSMSSITREELDAKLELMLARSDARARETELQAEARLSRFEERIDQAIGEMRRDGIELKAAISSLKTTTVVTALSAVLAIVLGVAAFNATVLSNMVASFESGKNTAASLSEANARLERLQDRMEANQAKPR